jgi:hypothetical protein
MMRRSAIVWILIIAAIYAGSYLWFRQTHTQVWQRDRQAYVIFPEAGGRALYYLWRPLSTIDGAATGMRFHIGPHR